MEGLISMNKLSTLMRGFKILRVLAKYGILKHPAIVSAGGWKVSLINAVFGGLASPDNMGQKLVLALQELGPVYVKLGQSLAVRPDIVGEDIANELRVLQDDLPPFDGDIAVSVIEEQLGKPIDVLFTAFDKIPVAAASIAQVHKAITPSGDTVAVKVLRPNVIRQFAHEIAFFKSVARYLLNLKNAYSSEIERFRPMDVVDTFQSWVRLETDLRMEAAAASEFAENLNSDPHWHVPAVYWDLTADRVLTTQWIDGVRIDDLDGLKSMHVDRDHVMTVASRVFLKQIFEHGFFHGDMHPGNMIVQSDGVLSPVDFGIMGRLDMDTRYFLADTLMGFLQQDYEMVSRAHFDYGIMDKNQDVQLFKQALTAIGEPYKNMALSDINIAGLLGYLFKTTQDFNMQVQPQLLLMQKTILVAEGVGRILNDKVNMWALSHDLILDWFKEHRGVQGRVKHQSKKVIHAVQTLPTVAKRLDDYVTDLEENGLRLSGETLRAFGGGRSSNWSTYGIVAFVLVFATAIAIVDWLVRMGYGDAIIAWFMGG